MAKADSIPQVDFYILTQTQDSDKYMYACRIANKAFGQGRKVYIQTDNFAQSELIDKMLWTFSQNSFVPHIILHSEKETAENSEDAELDIERYPVQISNGAAPKACKDILISLREEAPTDYSRFSRVVELIINDAADKSSGRARYKFYKEQGVEPNTHNIS